MKRRRGIFIGIALGALGVAVIVALAFAPAVQTRLARGFLQAQPGLATALDRVEVGWNSVRVEGLVLQQGPLTLRVPHLEADLPVWRLLRNRIALERLVAHGWELHFDPAAAVTAAPVVARRPVSRAAAGWLAPLEALGGVLAVGGVDAPAAGLGQVLAALRLPVDLSVDGVDLEGTAAWRDAGPGADGHARVTIFGGGLRAGQTGDLKVVIEAEGERAGTAGIRSLHIDANLGLRLADARTFDRVSLGADLTGRRDVQAEPDRFHLQFDLQVAEGAPRAEFTLRDNRLRLVFIELTRADDGDDLAGIWSLALNDASLGSLMLGRDLPGFSVEGQGTLRAAGNLSTGAVEGHASFVASDLAVLRSELRSMGMLSGNLVFGAEAQATGLRLTRLELGLNGAAPVLSARLLQGVEIAHESQELRVVRPEDPVFAVDLIGVPTAWAQPWLEPLVLDARPIRGGLVGLVSPHGLRVVTTAELVAEGLVAAQLGQTWLDEVDVRLQIGAEVTGEGWQVELDRLDLADAQGPLVTLSARGGRLTRENDVMKLAGRFQADLRTVEHVPLLADNLTLQGGRLEGEFGLGVEDRFSIAASLTASDLVLADGGSLPEMQVDGRLDLFRNGMIEAHLPMRFTHHGRVSDLTFNVSATPQGAAWQAEGSLSGPRAFVEDLQGLGLIVAAAPEGMAPVSPSGENGTGPARPLWAGWTGTFKTAIGELSLPNGLVLENVRGDVALEAARIRLGGLGASLAGGGEVQIEGGLEFDPTRPQPYAAQGRLRAEEIEVGALLRALNPAQLPPLEGRLSVTADLDSATVELEDLPTNATIEARVTSAGGILRALQVDLQQYLEAGRTLSAIGGLVAALSGRADLGRYAQKLDTATQVAEQLAALRFDQLNLELNRRPGGDYVLRDIAVISPGVRLLGNGRIHYDANTPLLASSLAVTLQLAAREEIGERLAELNLLRPEADALGYRPLVEQITLDGTVSEISADALGRLMQRALR